MMCYFRHQGDTGLAGDPGVKGDQVCALEFHIENLSCLFLRYTINITVILTFVSDFEKKLN